MPVLSTRILLDCFYLLIFYSEKFSTDVCRLPYAVNVNLNLSTEFQLTRQQYLKNKNFLYVFHHLSHWYSFAQGLTRNSVKKWPSSFRDATTGFPRNDVWEPCTEIPYWWRQSPDLGNASDWLKQISHAARPIRSTTQIWVVTLH